MRFVAIIFALFFFLQLLILVDPPWLKCRIRFVLLLYCNIFPPEKSLLLLPLCVRRFFFLPFLFNKKYSCAAAVACYFFNLIQVRLNEIPNNDRSFSSEYHAAVISLPFNLPFSEQTFVHIVFVVVAVVVVRPATNIRPKIQMNFVFMKCIRRKIVVIQL